MYALHTGNNAEFFIYRYCVELKLKTNPFSTFYPIKSNYHGNNLINLHFRFTRLPWMGLHLCDITVNRISCTTRFVISTTAF